MNFRTRFSGIELRATLQDFEDFYSGTLKNRIAQRLRVIRVENADTIESHEFRHSVYFEVERTTENIVAYTVRLMGTATPIASVEVQSTYIDGRIIFHAAWTWQATPFIWNLLGLLVTVFDAPPLNEAVDDASSRAELLRFQTQMSQPQAVTVTSGLEGAPRGIKLGTAERVNEFHRLVKAGQSHRQAKARAHCDPATYCQWCKRVTGEDPIIPYR